MPNRHSVSEFECEKARERERERRSASRCTTYQLHKYKPLPKPNDNGRSTDNRPKEGVICIQYNSRVSAGELNITIQRQLSRPSFLMLAIGARKEQHPQQHHLVVSGAVK